MNHLAHLFLAPASVPGRVGALLGDFARGIDTASLPLEVYQGLKHHRAVDAFTDRHPEVLACKPLFSAQRRRFAGVALDVLFDHYLLRHWSRFAADDSHHFIQEVYRDLELGACLMPDSMAHTTATMIRQDWFNAYRELDNVGHALDRISTRLRRPNQFAGVIEEIRSNDAELEARFLLFFHELQQQFDLP
ncbi:acyl carrier protein phosphodiesterase [Marinobacter sp. SS21]|uniref:acyl carrier protein phosphodiesterase n=1 Tax=Marinobacter sp. SS21 TaxID=2979460 RepID=UPI0023300992|nr:ACP phosphodiesterase [Marinobacter sp. SS21]MDC0664294.1 ACP phosphodiesterase [Marinobacter sp. SS21]